MTLRHPFLHRPSPIAIVHRGGPTDVPENTLAAFQQAYALGFRYFETDVRVTADGVLVAFHDHSLRRLAGVRIPIAELMFAEVEAVRIDGEPVPRLDDLLTIFPDVYFNIDPKCDAAVPPLAHLLKTRHVLDRVCLASFSDRRLRWLRTALGPNLCSAAGPREIAQAAWAASRRRPLRAPRYDVLQLPVEAFVAARIADSVVASAHGVGIPVHVWTVNARADMERLLRLGVDGLMTDDPHQLRELFLQLDLWPPDS